MLEALIISIFAAFVCRTLAVMVSYCLAYGQLFGWVKLWVAKQIEPDVINNFANDKQSDNETVSIDVYDHLCEVKYKTNYPLKARTWSYVISLLDCRFCIGFWLSLICSICVHLHGYNPLVFLFIPVFTFFMTEKI